MIRGVVPQRGRRFAGPFKLVVAFAVLTLLAMPASYGEESYSIVTDRIYVPLADGTRLQALIQRPDAPGRFPVILTFGPYGNGSTPNPELVKLVTRGYVSVSASIRGSSCSQGTMDIFSEQEARDGAELVEWAAVQGWSDGNVGLQGQSYLAINQFLIAAQKPPHLRAIAPHAFLGDLYRDVGYPGGVFEWGMSLGFSPLQHAQQAALGVAVGAVTEAQAAGTTCLQNQRGREGNPEHFTTRWTVEHPFDDSEWQRRSPVTYLDRIDVPVLMLAAFQDDQVGSRGITMFERLNTPKKMILTNGVHATPTSLFWNQLFESVTLRWYDHWLKGIDTGLMDEAPVTVLFDTTSANDAGFVRTYEAWPAPTMQHSALYLREGGILSDEPPESREPFDEYLDVAGAVSNAKNWWHVPRAGLSYTTDPLTDDIIVAGPAALTLFASSSAEDTDFFVTLSDVDAAGNVTFVQKGLLRASHRAISEDSTLQEPYHPHNQSERMTPETVYQFAIELLPVGHAFRAGHRIRLDIGGPPVAPEPFWGYTPSSAAAVNHVFHEPEAMSRLWLPIVPTGGDLSPAPLCGALVGQPCRQSSPT